MGTVSERLPRCPHAAHQRRAGSKRRQDSSRPLTDGVYWGVFYGEESSAPGQRDCWAAAPSGPLRAGAIPVFRGSKTSPDFFLNCVAIFKYSCQHELRQAGGPPPSRTARRGRVPALLPAAEAQLPRGGAKSSARSAVVTGSVAFNIVSQMLLASLWQFFSNCRNNKTPQACLFT